MSDLDICCRKSYCKTQDERLLEEHHFVPQYMGGKDTDGRVYLCRKHHAILHNMLPLIIWRHVPEENRVSCRADIIEFTERWLRT